MRGVRWPTLLVAAIFLAAAGFLVAGGLSDDDSPDGATEVAGTPAAESSSGKSPSPQPAEDEKSLDGPGFTVPYPAEFGEVSVDSDKFPLGQVTALSERGGGAVGLDEENWIAAYPFPLPSDVEGELDRTERVAPAMEAYGLRLGKLHSAAAEQAFGEPVDPFTTYASVDGAPGVVMEYSYPASAGKSFFRVVQVFGRDGGLAIVQNSSLDTPAAEVISDAFEQAVERTKLDRQ